MILQIDSPETNGAELSVGENEEMTFEATENIRDVVEDVTQIMTRLVSFVLRANRIWSDLNLEHFQWNTYKSP